MKVYLYSQHQSSIAKSGIGRAYLHQKEALKRVGVDVVDDRKEADLIHINTAFTGTPTMVHWAKKYHKPVIIHAHSTEEDFRNSFVGSNAVAPLYGKWLKTIYNLGDAVITPTPYAKRTLEAMEVKKPIVAISNGIDVDYYRREKISKEAFRGEYGLGEGPVVLSVGLPIERKGILDMAEIARMLPEVNFLWFGGISTKLLTSQVKELMKRPPENLHFPGYISREKLREAYYGADLFLFPSYEETEGIVVLEALAAEVPVLARDIGVYEGWLEDGKSAHLAKSTREFLRKARIILDHQCSDTRREGRKVAESKSYDAVGRQLKNLYEKVLRRR
ncbi:MAG: glycosyltransferase [Tissierellia bacterium]|nr:glycosyltransferase [Tissierellia bacterium]